MIYSDFAITQLLSRLREKSMRKTIPKKIAGDLFEAWEVIVQLRTELKNINRVKWIPAIPGEMPQHTEYAASEDLILRVVDREADKEYVSIYAGFYQDGHWYSYMNGGCSLIDKSSKVTHWMYISALPEVEP